MATNTSLTPSASERGQTDPPDITTMRETVNRLLDPDSAPEALPPAGEELATLISTLRGHLNLLVPKVEKAVGGLDKASSRRYAILGCVWEARSRLETQPNSRTGGPIGHARRLARVLNALLDHHEQLTMASRTTEQAARNAMLDHYTGCPTCTATDDEGKTLNTVCETGNRLHQEYRQACRTARSKDMR